MNRLKLLAAIAVLGLPLAACEETTPPPPVGSIVGTVSIEGTGIDGVSVNLSNGNTTTTAGGGSFRFDNVEGGAYTVTISGYPSDATFDATSAAATIASAGQSVTLNFTGAYIRTASVMGTVTVENMGLGGVTVALSGVSSASAVTDDNGQYAFTGLRMGNYAVEISGFDNDEVGFSATAASVTVGVGESKIISFDGTYLRTAGIMGQVSVEGAGLEGVTVSLAGGPDATDMTTMTDASGQYSFSKLRAGDYAVGISGYDTDDYEFEVTSENVTVALGETANVPFEGVLLRTAGVSGRVSVEGIGLEDVMVTLSMADTDDMMAMTDAGGLYAFSGLAAGDYTVAIALSDEQMAAYVFESTSADVTLEDDMTSIVNFEAEHAATASVTVQLFVDEGANGRNDMMDEGEPGFPTEAMLAMVAELGLPLALPITLAGPGVHDMQSGMAMPDGSVVFSNLKAGQYQVIVSDIPAEALALMPPALADVLADYAYGGPATGYPVALTVGQEAMQYAPIDITHTTVHFGVTLRHGETPGMPLPGAMVTLYADAMGETKVDEGMTMVDEETMHAVASMRIERASTTGNMVYAGVTADSAYTVADGMTPVPWDPQKTYTQGGNANDIVNLNVDFTYGGATIEKEYGGGDPLAGWAVTVAHGETMHEDTLDADGMAAFKMTVDSAGALPAVFAISVDSVQVDSLDGGEMFEAISDDPYIHSGLTLAGTEDAGMIEVEYSTQTLKVSVHHELDQVLGYTGNVLQGDVRDDGMVDLSIRFIDDAGRSRSFTTKEWDAGKNTSFKDGVTTFEHLPADHNVIVQAHVAEDEDDEPYPIELLEPDELAAYTAMEANGVMGGAFGDMGGFSHTVELCPLQATNPQEHDECSSFAYVSTHNVSGLIWKRSIEMDDSDDFKAVDDPDFVKDIYVSLTPVEGKNLAGEDQSATTTEKAVKGLGETSKGNEVLDERFEFDFGAIAAGAYKVDVSDGWRYRLGSGVLYSAHALIKDSEDKVTDELSPLGDDLTLDITPATMTVYGFVVGSDGFAMDSATVTANGVSTLTDEHGRYIIEGINPGIHTVAGKKTPNLVKVEASVAGVGKDSEILGFAANAVTKVTDKDGFDLTISAAAETATISGTVRASGTAAPVDSVKVEVSYDGGTTFVAPENKNAKDPPTRTSNNIHLTGPDGTYTVKVKAQKVGEGVAIRVTKDDMSFVPAEIDDIPAHFGSNVSGFDFTGFEHATITGRVVRPGGGPMSGVTVTATTDDEGATATATDVTGRTGTFSLSVPFDRYTIAASAGTTSLTRFTYPDDEQDVRVAPGVDVAFGSITGASVNARSISTSRMKNDDGNYTGTVDISWRFDNIDGWTSIVHAIETCATEACADADWTAAGFTADTDTDTEHDPDEGISVGTFTAPDAGDLGFRIRINVSATEPVTDADGNATTEARTGTSDERTVARVNSSPSGITAVRDTDEDAEADSLIVNWKASTNLRTVTRVVVTVEIDGLGEQSLVAAGGVLLNAGETDEDATSAVYIINDGTNGFTAADWTVVGTTQTLEVTEEILRQALEVRVETRQAEEVDEDDEEVWHATATVEVDADPEST